MSRIVYIPVGLDPSFDGVISAGVSSVEGLLAAKEVGELTKAAAAQYSKQAQFNCKIEKTCYKEMGWIG